MSRNKVAKYIINSLSKYSIYEFQSVPINFTHAYYKLYIKINSKFINEKINNQFILQFLQQNNIPSGAGTCPEIYLEKAFKKNQLSNLTRFKNAKYLGKYSFALNITHLYNAKHCDYVISKLSKLASMHTSD